MNEQINADKNAIFSTINQLQGFNPLDFARELPAEAPDVPPQKYLDVMYRVSWFRLKYPNGKIVKRVVSLDERMAVIEARIYKDVADPEGDFLANGFGQRMFDGNTVYGERNLECAETAAVGRALSAAGFNITGGGAEGEESQVDGGIPSTAATPAAASQEKNKSQATQTSKKEKQPDAATETPQISEYSETSPVDEILKLITIDEAKKVIIPSGFNKGKTLGEIALEKPSGLEWYRDKYSGPNNILRAASRFLLEAAA